MTAALHRRQLIEGAAFVGPADDDPPPALLELLAAIRRRKGLVLATALATLMMAGAVLSLVSERYDAVAEILVEPKAPNVVSFEELAPGPDIADVSPASEVRMILSTEIFARAVDRLRLTADPEFNAGRAAAPEGLPAQAMVWLTEALGWRAPVVFADGEAAVRAEQALTIRNLRRATVVYPVEKSRVVAVRVSSVRADKAALIANTLVDLHLRAQLEERRASAARATEWLTERLDELTAEARGAADRADAFRSDTAAAAAFSAETAAALLRDLTSALENARADGRAGRAATLARAVEAVRGDLRRIARLEAELSQLEEEAAAAKAIQSAFRNRLAEARAQADVQRLDTRMVAAASAPLRPSAPNTRMILALALAGGLTLGAGLAAMADSLRAPFRTVRQVEAMLGLPVAAVVPRAPGLFPNAVRYGRERPGSRLAEAVRDLRVLVDRPRSGEAAPPQVVALASARPTEGKSTLAALLADSLARSGRRTLLIDCDLRRPSAAAIYGAEAAEDVVAVLDGEVALDEAVWTDPATGVDVLTAQPCPASRSDLFATPAFAALIGAARARYDAIVLDTPPVLALSDARLVAAAADAVVLAVRWADTPQEEAVAALRLLQEVGAKMSGVALTRAGRGADHRINIKGGRPRYGRFSEYFAD